MIKWTKTGGLQFNPLHDIAKGTPEEFGASKLSESYERCTEQEIITMEGEITDEYRLFRTCNNNMMVIGEHKYQKSLLFAILEDMEGRTLLLKDGSRLRKCHCGKKFRLNVKSCDTVLILSEKMSYMLTPMIEML